MPTGYTSKLYEGPVKLLDFVIECSKAFCVAFREADPGADYEEVLKDEYEGSIKRYERQVREQEKRVEESKTLTLAKAKEYLDGLYRKSLAEQQEKKQKYDEREVRFTKMRDDILAMPIDEKDEFLVNLRRFMLEQLSHDIHPNGKHYYSEPPAPYTDDDAADYVTRERENAEECLRQARGNLKDCKDAYEEQKRRVQVMKDLVRKVGNR